MSLNPSALMALPAWPNLYFTTQITPKTQVYCVGCWTVGPTPIYASCGKERSLNSERFLEGTDCDTENKGQRLKPLSFLSPSQNLWKHSIKLVKSKSPGITPTKIWKDENRPYSGPMSIGPHMHWSPRWPKQHEISIWSLFWALPDKMRCRTDVFITDDIFGQMPRSMSILLLCFVCFRTRGGQTTGGFSNVYIWPIQNVPCCIKE